MSATDRHENVNRFVASARRLIIVQIIVAIVALIAAIAATVLIWRAFVEQGEAAEATREAELAREDAALAKIQADQAIQQSQRELRRIATMRPILQATTWQEYAAAADELEETARQIPDEDVYALLAAAHYRGASPENADRANRLVKATALLLEATRLNKKRVDETKGSSSSAEKAEYNIQLFTDYIGVQCAVLRSSDRGSADILNSLQLLAMPVDVVEILQTENELRRSPIIERECGQSFLETIESFYRIDAFSPGSFVRSVNFDIGKVFMQISDEQDRALAAAISRDLEQTSNLQVPGIERIVSAASAYKPSIRYYHQAQLRQAEEIQLAVLRSANTNNANWTETDIPLVKLNLADLPRDRLEVWLPSQSSLRTSRTAKFDISTTLSVVYFQRSADGLTVLNTLENLLPEANLVVDSSQVELAAVNAINCSPDASQETMESLQQLALSLIDAGVGIKTIGAAERAGPASQIEIRHDAEARQRPILTEEQVKATTTCPSDVG
jgi:hypothetical protein